MGTRTSRTSIAGRKPLLRPQSPVIVLEVESCAQRAQDVVNAGGSLVIGPNEVGGGMGIYAQVKDSEGNTIGLWQPLPRHEA